MELSSKRLRLREFEAADWEAVLAYQQKAAYLRYYPWENRTAADVQAFIELFLGHQRAASRTKFQLVIQLNKTGQLIGNCGLRLHKPNSTPAVLGAGKTTKQIAPHAADIGYELDPEHWGKGYATEAASTMINYGFSHFQLRRISANCVADNHGSVRVLEKVGMTQEGCLRESEYFKGRYWDVLLYAILKRDWQATIN